MAKKSTYPKPHTPEYNGGYSIYGTPLNGVNGATGTSIENTVMPDYMEKYGVKNAREMKEKYGTTTGAVVSYMLRNGLATKPDSNSTPPKVQTPPSNTGGNFGSGRSGYDAGSLPPRNSYTPNPNPSGWSDRWNTWHPYPGDYGSGGYGYDSYMPNPYQSQIDQLTQQISQLTSQNPWDGFFEKLQAWQAQQEAERRKRESMFDWNKVLYGSYGVNPFGSAPATPVLNTSTLMGLFG